MLPSDALKHEFHRLARDKGDAYVQPGIITIQRGTTSEVSALVRGREPYLVRIRRVPAGTRTSFLAACSCPWFKEQLTGCKHIWAVLRWAERRGHLIGTGGPTLTPNSTALECVQGGGFAPTSGSSWSEPVAPRTAADFLDNVALQLSIRDTDADRLFRYADSTLLYAIDGPESAGQPHVVVKVLAQRKGAAGTAAKPKAVTLSAAEVRLAPPADRRILAMLFGAGRRHPQGGMADYPSPATFEVPGPLAAELLPMIARTARGWYRRGSDPVSLEPITWDTGDAWRFDLKIDPAGDRYRVTGALVREDVAVPIAEAFQPLAGGLVVVRRSLARLEEGPAGAFLAELQRSGPIEVSAAEAVTLAELVARSGLVSAEVPVALRVAELRTSPSPRLSLRTNPDRLGGGLEASLAFDYGGSIAPATAGQPSFFDGMTRRLVHRDRTAESAARQRLLDLGLRPSSVAGSLDLELPLHQMTTVVRTLVAEGWRVEADGVRYRTPLAVNLTVTSGIDWFDLSAEIAFGDTMVPLTEVLAALKPGATNIELGDGTVGLLPEEWFQRYAGLGAAGEIVGDRIRFRRSQAAMLDALLERRAGDTAIRTDALFERARSELAAFHRIAPIDPPASFRGVLRDYQREGLGWFAFLRQFGFGGCLADDMGLGKTIMVLALLDARRQEPRSDETPRRPSLIVVPRSLVGNWIAEARAFTPGLQLVDHSHGQRVSGETTFAGADAVLVTYGTLRRDIATLSSVEFDYVVLDEAQTIKNAATAAAKASRLVRAAHRLALSGTPIENHLGELWSLFEFLNPGVLGRSSAFREVTAPGRADPETTALIARGLRPFILRRTKQQVARELPERTEQTILCELHPRDRRLYDALRRHYRTTLLDRIDREGLGRTRMHALEALLRLRQVACHAGLVDPKRVGDESAKFDVLLPQLQEVVAEGHKALVFSQFTTLLDLLRKRLDAAKLPYEHLDGKTRDRATRVRRFQEDPAVPVFLISLKAGGLGLNLTAAEYVFLLDPWWNPAVEAQAIDRAHRIGQTREVFAYRLIAKDTVEEKVLMLQKSKRDLADAVLAADAVGLRDLGRDDLLLLLS